jgi:cytochrome b561
MLVASGQCSVDFVAGNTASICRRARAQDKTMAWISCGMVASLSDYHWLISIHRPLGILILVLVAIRLVNRLLNPVPSLPDGMPGWQRFVAHTSHVVLYALMFTLPLVG